MGDRLLAGQAPAPIQTRRNMKLHAVLFLFAVISAARAAEEDNRRRDRKPARIVLLSDTHIFGGHSRPASHPAAAACRATVAGQPVGQPRPAYPSTQQGSAA